MKKRLLFCLSLALCALTTVKAEEVDYTSSITNAEMASLDGWTSTGSTSSSYGDGLVKLGSGSDYNFYQTITLPAGQYKVTAQAAYRYASGSVNVAEQAEYAAIQAGTDTHLAKFYAQTATYKYEANVQNRWEGRSGTDYFGNLEKVSVIEHESVTYYVPNSSAAVKAWFDNGKYVNELVFNVQEEGEVAIGIAKTVGAPSGDYTNIGAWTLTRIGDAEADPEVEVPALEVGDVTSQFLVNADFEQASAQNGNAINEVPGWTLKHETSGWLDGSTRTSTNSGGDGSQCYNLWAGTVTLADIYQSVVLPAGKYVLTVGLYSDNSAERYAYATVGGNTIKSATPTAGSWDFVDVEFVNSTEGEVILGAVSKGWFQIDNVTLEYLGEASNDELLNVAKTEFTTAYDEFCVAFAACQALMLKQSFYEVADAAYQLSEQLETTTDVDALNAMVEDLNEATASLNEINEVYAEYDVYVQKFKAASEISMPMTTEANDLLEYNMYGGAGMQATSVDALEAAVPQIAADYLTYIANAELLDGNMFDLTYLIQNPNFESNLDGWTANKANRIGGEGYDGVGGIAEIGDWYASSWDASMSQDITGLPNGKYMVKMAWMAEIGIKMTFAANDSIVEVTGIGDTGGNIAKDGSVVEMGSGHRGWQYAEVVGRVMDGTLTIKVSSSSTALNMWSNADAFELYYVDTIPGATDEQKLAFAAALATAEAHTLGFAVGEYAPYTNVEAAKALAAAKAIDLEGDVVAETLTAVQAALVAAVWTANTEEMNAIYDGTFAADYSGQTGNVKPTGWNRTSGTNTGYEVRYMALPEGVSTTGYGMFIKFTANYGKEEGYTMPLKANTAYKLSFDYAGWGNNPTVSVLVKDVDGNELTVVPNSITATSNAGNSDASVWQSYEGEFTTGDADTDYILYFDKSESDQLQIAFANFQLYEVKGIVDAIDAPAVQPAEAVIYDLQGRRVAKMEKGIYIVNGVKVMVK